MNGTQKMIGRMLVAGLLALAGAIGVAAQGIEALSVRAEGSVFVKKPGKKFSEALRVGVRYPAGTQIKSDAGAAAEFILSDSSSVTVPASTTWVVGEAPAGMVKRKEAPAGQAGLWDIMVAKLERTNTTAANSSVVGAVRGAPAESPLSDGGTAADRALFAEKALKLAPGSDSASCYLRAVYLESVGMLASAEQAYRDSWAAAAGPENKRLAGLALVDLLDRNGRPMAAEDLRFEWEL